MDKLALLEDSYVASGYLPRRYTKREVEDKFKLSEKLLELVEACEGH